jgi:Ca-activated chloride channel family protein
MKDLLIDISFAYPYLLLLLIIVPLLIFWYIYKYRKSSAEMQTSSLDWFEEGKHKSLRQRFFHLPFVFKTIALIFLILAISRPQTRSKRVEKESCQRSCT